jgi:hypothetical protein
MLSSLMVALALSAEPHPKKAGQLKDLVKLQPAQSADGGTLSNGLDVSKMPFTPDSIKQVVVSFQPQIQACYEEHLAAKSKAVEGTLKTTFLITVDGYVKSAKVNRQTSTLKDPHVHECVVAVLSAMEFPKPPDGKEHPIEFPFNLKAQH